MIKLRHTNGAAVAAIERLFTIAEHTVDQAGRLAERSRQWSVENARLRRLTDVDERVRIVRRAQDAALKIAVLHLNQVRTSREVVCRLGGISERYYFWARALLELAGVFAKGEFTTDDADLIENNLKTAARAAEAKFHLLTRRMPASRRPKTL